MRASLPSLLMLLPVACALDSPPDPDNGILCGNGVIDPGEGCDPMRLTESILEIGPIFRLQKCHKGELVCEDDCTVPPDACQEYCGDGEVNGDEACDGEDFAIDCVEGRFLCNDDCSIDRSECQAWCGDSVITAPEQCEPTLQLPEGACYDGEVSCKPDCTYDLVGCYAFCGDDVLNGEERCDGMEFHSPCHDSSGIISCRRDCTIEPNGCTAYCGDGKTNGSEECDGDHMPTRSCLKAVCLPDCTMDDSGC